MAGNNNQRRILPEYDKKELTHPIQKGNITSFYQDSEGELWIGSWEEGLFRVKADGAIKNFNTMPEPTQSLLHFVRACCEDNLGNIWIVLSTD